MPATIGVLDKDGAAQTVNTLPALGQAAMAASLPVVIASDQSILGGFDVQTTVTRPADTTAYASGDAIADSTSAPTTGGFTLSSVASASGKLVMINDIFITSSKASTLQGWLYIFNQAATANNDNAAFALSDADLQNAIAILSFGMTAEPSNSWAHLQGLGIVAACVGTANLRFLLKTAAAYTPDNAEVFTIRAKGQRLS
jgi:hypothetical protein